MTDFTYADTLAPTQETASSRVAHSFILRYGLYLAWLVAIVATLGSLYFSDIRHFIPCKFCWYQRILMYPLVVLLGIASYKNDRDIVLYALPFSIVGMGVATYHYLDQKIPTFGPPTSCSAFAPCNATYVNWLGFITIPFMALTAFLLITGLLIALWLEHRRYHRHSPTSVAA